MPMQVHIVSRTAIEKVSRSYGSILLLLAKKNGIFAYLNGWLNPVVNHTTKSTYVSGGRKTC